MSELTSRIDDAFTRSDSEDAIRLVKAAVQDELRGLDAGLSIEETRFFNHAIHPDLVLGWHERGESYQRPLYLRFEVTGGAVAQDLRLHGERAPMLIGLLDHRADADDDLPDIDALEVETEVDGDEQVSDPPAGGALLAEAAAVDLLEDFARERPNQMIATSALMRGGHGHLSGDGVRVLGNTLGAGFEAASEGRDAELVRTAYGHLEELVSPGQAAQLATHLQLMWLGSGGELADLFGEGVLEVEGLSDLQLRELLEYLLTRDEAPPASTLRRFAFMDPDRLGQLLRNFDGGHLGALVDANLSQWGAKWVQVLEGGPVGWRLDDELLRLGLGDVQLTFTSRGRKLSRFTEGEAVPRGAFTPRLASDQAIALEMVSEEAELALRRRTGVEAGSGLRPEQIDALGDLASFVLRGTLKSPALLPPGAGGEGMQVEVDYGRGLCAFADEVTMPRARRFAERYFALPSASEGHGA